MLIDSKIDSEVTNQDTKYVGHEWSGGGALTAFVLVHVYYEVTHAVLPARNEYRSRMPHVLGRTYYTSWQNKTKNVGSTTELQSYISTQPVSDAPSALSIRLQRPYVKES